VLADAVGTGKSAQMAALIAILKETGQLEHGRVLVVCRAPAVMQWVKELNRMLPCINTAPLMGPAKKRLATLRSDWEVLVVGREMFNRDSDAFNHIALTAMFIDDVDSLRNRRNAIAVAIKRVANHCRWVVVANATPLQKKLKEIHSVLEPVGGRDIFGSETRFLNTYTLQKKIQIPVRGGRLMTQKQTTGYVNIQQFKSLMAPMVLRRTAADLDDVEMPAINPSTVWLELHPAQRQKYKEVQAGILKIIKDGSISDIKMLEAITVWMKGGAVCSGLAAIGEDDGPGTSVKLDWIMDTLDGDLSDEKVIVFLNNRKMIKAAQARMDNAGIEHVTISGMDANHKRRAASVERFWNDDSCQVLIGSASLESSLNLQTSRHMILGDLIMNPARVQQLVGRIQRQGSRYKHVFVHTLLTRDTQEERYLAQLEIESALSDHIFDSSSELFEQLPPEDLMRLILS
jgi:SNF2 family DNA or RNA helicase